MAAAGPRAGARRPRRYHAPEGDKDKPQAQKKAVKCDMCKGIDGGPACVRACPTGAAIRVAPEQFLGAMAQQ